jgi:hypothetical protein
MGEKIRDIGKFKIADQDVKIELNEGYDKKYSEYDIHIQSDHIQYSLTNRQFVKLAAVLINSKEKLNFMKNSYNDF